MRLGPRQMEMLEYIAECGRCEVLGLVRRTYQSLLASGLLREEGIYLAVTASGEKLVSAGARLKLGVYRRTGGLGIRAGRLGGLALAVSDTGGNTDRVPAAG